MCVSISNSGLIYFMPEFLSNFSKWENYGIILIQQLCGVPGVFAGAYLVETKLGRRYTASFGFIFAGAICLPFYADKSAWIVTFI